MKIVYVNENSLLPYNEVIFNILRCKRFHRTYSDCFNLIKELSCHLSTGEHYYQHYLHRCFSALSDGVSAQKKSSLLQQKHFELMKSAAADQSCESYIKNWLRTNNTEQIVHFKAFYDAVTDKLIFEWTISKIVEKVYLPSFVQFKPFYKNKIIVSKQ